MNRCQFISEKVVVSHTKETFEAAIVGLAINNAISFRFFMTKSLLAHNNELVEKIEERIFDHIVL
jgi:hypothetical protein